MRQDRTATCAARWFGGVVFSLIGVLVGRRGDEMMDLRRATRKVLRSGGETRASKTGKRQPEKVWLPYGGILAFGLLRVNGAAQHNLTSRGSWSSMVSSTPRRWMTVGREGGERRWIGACRSVRVSALKKLAAWARVERRGG